MKLVQTTIEKLCGQPGYYGEGELRPYLGKRPSWIVTHRDSQAVQSAMIRFEASVNNMI